MWDDYVIKIPRLENMLLCLMLCQVNRLLQFHTAYIGLINSGTLFCSIRIYLVYILTHQSSSLTFFPSKYSNHSFLFPFSIKNTNFNIDCEIFSIQQFIFSQAPFGTQKRNQNGESDSNSNSCVGWLTGNGIRIPHSIPPNWILV